MRKSACKTWLGATLAIVSTSPACAADEDSQIWLAANATVDVSKTWLLYGDIQMRITDDAARIGQTVIRPGIGYRIGPNTTVIIGYMFAHSDPVGPTASDEHRAWQQIAFRVTGNGKGTTVTGRTRLEQRWIVGAPDMGWRLRQQLRVTTPLNAKLRGIYYAEAFVTFDDTSWGQHAGLDRIRNFIGLSIPLSKKVTIEPGYINQYIVRRGRDRMHHVLSTTLSARF